MNVSRETFRVEGVAGDRGDLVEVSKRCGVCYHEYMEAPEVAKVLGDNDGLCLDCDERGDERVGLNNRCAACLSSITYLNSTGKVDPWKMNKMGWAWFTVWLATLITALVL